MNKEESHLENVELVTPFVMTIVGPKRVGKTTFIRTLLTKNLLQKCKHVVVFSKTAHLSRDFDWLESHPGITSTIFAPGKTPDSDETIDYAEIAKRLFKRLITLLQTEGTCPSVLLILDDLAADPIMSEASPVVKECITHRHINMSMICVGHAYRGAIGIPKAMRLQIDYCIFFNPSSMKELEDVLKDTLFSTDVKTAIQEVREILTVPFNYIVYKPAAAYSEKLLINFKEPLDSLQSRKRQKELDEKITKRKRVKAMLKSLRKRTKKEIPEDGDQE